MNKATANKSIANSGAGRWSNRQQFAFSFGSGWTFAIWLFVIIFIKSFSIELWLPGAGFSTLPPSAILFRYAPPEFITQVLLPQDLKQLDLKHFRWTQEQTLESCSTKLRLCWTRFGPTYDLPNPLFAGLIFCWTHVLLDLCLVGLILCWTYFLQDSSFAGLMFC